MAFMIFWKNNVLLIFMTNFVCVKILDFSFRFLEVSRLNDFFSSDFKVNDTSVYD